MINGQRFPRRKMVQDIYSSRTYVQIRRMVLVSLYGVSDLSSIMSDYSDGVGFREMMQLMTLIVMMVLMI
jgi:succinate dehydrogenase hydrophobic anchor subunit